MNSKTIEIKPRPTIPTTNELAGPNIAAANYLDASQGNLVPNQKCHSHESGNPSNELRENAVASTSGGGIVPAVTSPIKSPFCEKGAGGLVTLSKIDTPSGRFYTIPNKGTPTYYPSVTTILKTYFQSFLARWRGELGNAEADRQFIEAGQKGTQVHELFSDLIAGRSIFYKNVPDSIATPYKIVDDDFIFVQLYRLHQFFEIVKPEILKSEFAVYSDKYKYAGSLDLLLKVKGGTYLINGRNAVTIKEGIYVADIKTANNIFINYHWQTAAYAKAVTERSKSPAEKLARKITGTMILHTKSKVKNGIEGFSCLVRDSKQMKQDFANFLKVKSLYDIDAPEEPTIYKFPNKLQLNIKVK